MIKQLLTNKKPQMKKTIALIAICLVFILKTASAFPWADYESSGISKANWAKMTYQMKEAFYTAWSWFH